MQSEACSLCRIEKENYGETKPRSHQSIVLVVVDCIVCGLAAWHYQSFVTPFARLYPSGTYAIGQYCASTIRTKQINWTKVWISPSPYNTLCCRRLPLVSPRTSAPSQQQTAVRPMLLLLRSTTSSPLPLPRRVPGMNCPTLANQNSTPIIDTNIFIEQKYYPIFNFYLQKQ